MKLNDAIDQYLKHLSQSCASASLIRQRNWAFSLINSAIFKADLPTTLSSLHSPLLTQALGRTNRPANSTKAITMAIRSLAAFHSHYSLITYPRSITRTVLPLSPGRIIPLITQALSSKQSELSGSLASSLAFGFLRTAAVVALLEAAPLRPHDLLNIKSGELLNMGSSDSPRADSGLVVQGSQRVIYPLTRVQSGSIAAYLKVRDVVVGNLEGSDTGQLLVTVGFTPGSGPAGMALKASGLQRSWVRTRSEIVEYAYQDSDETTRMFIAQIPTTLDLLRRRLHAA